MTYTSTAPTTRFLTSSEDYLSAMEESARWAEKIWVASYRMSEGPAVSALVEFARGGGELRVLIRQAKRQREEAAAKDLLSASASCLRWSNAGARLFHPKLFIFVRGKDARVLVGSANLTREAFSTNVEVGCLHTARLAECQPIVAFFQAQWEQGRRIDTDGLELYEEECASRETYFQERQRRDEREIVAELLTCDLPRYVQQVVARTELLDEWGIYWGDGSLKPHETLRLLSGLTRQPWTKLSKDQKRALMGGHRNPEIPTAAFLGNMTANGVATSLLTQSTEAAVKVQKIIDRALKSIPEAPTKPDLGQAERAYKEITSLQAVGHAMATRFLALRRPDYFVSMNAPARDGFAKLFNMTRQELSTWEGYGAMLEALWKAPWMRAANPRKSRHARQLWEVRAALLDLFTYSPSHTEIPPHDF